MHFRRAWSRAHIQDILARLTGRSNDLLAYDDIRRKLKGSASRKRDLKDIPLAAIVGVDHVLRQSDQPVLICR
jgi:hypothetical protein